MKKLLLGIFISLGLILAMSHNVGAVEFTLNFDDYTLSRNVDVPKIDLDWNQTETCSNIFICNVIYTTDYARVHRIQTGSSYSAKANDIVVLRLLVANQASNGFETSGSPFNQRAFGTDNSKLIFIGHKTYVVDNQNILSQLGYGPNANEYYTQLTTVYKNISIYEYYFKVLQDDNYKFGFKSSSYTSPLRDIFVFPSYSTSSSVYFSFINLQQYSYKKSAQESAAEQEIESSENISNQTPPSQNETGDGQSATNLIGAFSGFVSALGGLSATNCNLTLNFPEFAGGSRVVNVCQNKDKAGNIISVFSSLTLIIFYVPLAIRLLTMIYNEIRSFTNG